MGGEVVDVGQRASGGPGSGARGTRKEVMDWYSVWSHRRSQLWKGFVQVDLAPAEDAAAAATLASVANAGGRP